MERPRFGPLKAQILLFGAQSMYCALDTSRAEGKEQLQKNFSPTPCWESHRGKTHNRFCPLTEPGFLNLLSALQSPFLPFVKGSVV